MRTNILLLAVSMAVIQGCSKQKSHQQAFYGVWIENSLRADTLDFEYGTLIDYSGDHSLLYFSSKVYTDTVLNPNYPVNHSSGYDYYFENNQSKIRMRSNYSSSTDFGDYNFSLSADGRSFIIDKFYNRRALPASLQFVRIR